VLVLPLALLRPVRCEDCGKRHYTLFFAEGLPVDAEREKGRVQRVRTRVSEREEFEGES